jgi:hypothetical protein
MVKSMMLAIYNLDGELVKLVPTQSKKVDVKLEKNVYFMKVHNYKGQLIESMRVVVN